jgi:protease II
MHYRSTRRSSLQVTLYIAAALCIIAVFVGESVFYRLSAETITITPLSTVVKQKGSGKDSKQVYLISAQLEDGTTEVFESTDTLLFFKYNSADVFFALENNKGKRFTVKVAGWRVPFLSWNRNIITAEIKEK